MPTAPPGSNAIINRYRIPLLLVLIVAGLTGNYFKYPIFLNIDFLFGSIFAMLALQFFGPGRGIAAAAIIACYTYILWNHPYAVIVMTAFSEVVISRIGAAKPIVMMLAPVVHRGTYDGYVVGVLLLEQIKDYLEKSSGETTSFYNDVMVTLFH